MNLGRAHNSAKNNRKFREVQMANKYVNIFNMIKKNPRDTQIKNNNWQPPQWNDNKIKIKEDWFYVGLARIRGMHFLMEKMDTAFLEGNLADSIKMKKCLSFDPEVLLLQLDSTEIQRYKEAWIKMLIARYLVKLKNWKLLKFLWINKLWYTHTMEYCTEV